MSTASVMSRDRAVEALWTGLRVVSVDLETAGRKDYGTKIVSIGMVTCRAGRVVGRWSSLVNPGVPITRASTRIHGIRDEAVALEQGFPDLAATVMAALNPAPGERLVVVAHNAAFDIPVLRDELAHAGHFITDLPVLDTMGRLRAAAGVAPEGNSLASLLAELGITNAAPHDALADAVATAEAAIEMLARIAASGRTDIDQILRDVEATTTLTQAAGGRPRDDGVVNAPVLSEEHLATHQLVLKPSHKPRTQQRWLDGLVECAGLRCSHAADKVATAQVPTADLVVLLEQALALVVDDGPGAATLLDAAGTVLARVTEGSRDARTARPKAMRLHTAWGDLVGELPRCDADRCAACQQGQPCGLDTWEYHLASAALFRFDADTVWSFLPTSGEHRRNRYSVWTTWTSDGHGALADAALWQCYEWYRDQQRHENAAALAETAWKAGCRQPRLALAYADAVARPGREADLRAAIDIATVTLGLDPQPGPPEHWRTLAARRTELEGRLARLPGRPTGKLDEDGNPIFKRRHHPAQPRRNRPPRFLRGS